MELVANFGFTIVARLNLFCPAHSNIVLVNVTLSWESIDLQDYLILSITISPSSKGRYRIDT